MINSSLRGIRRGRSSNPSNKLKSLSTKPNEIMNKTLIEGVETYFKTVHRKIRNFANNYFNDIANRGEELSWNPPKTPGYPL